MVTVVLMHQNIQDGHHDVNNTPHGIWVDRATASPTHGGVPVASAGADSCLTGYVWTENAGWIHFKNASPAYNVRTTAFDVAPPLAGPTLFRFR